MWTFLRWRHSSWWQDHACLEPKLDVVKLNLMHSRWGSTVMAQTMTTDLVKFIQWCYMSLTVHLALVLWPSWSWFVAIVVCGHHSCGRHGIGPSRLCGVVLEQLLNLWWRSGMVLHGELHGLDKLYLHKCQFKETDFGSVFFCISMYSAGNRTLQFQNTSYQNVWTL